VVEEQKGCLVLQAMRNLVLDDVRSAEKLSAAASWNQTAEDWHRILHLSPDGCRCIEDAGSVVATTTLLPFGTRLGWIGMVLTSLKYRRRGLARMLIEDAIASAEGRGIRTLKLDATEEGRPLYESLGFVVEKEIERWGRDSGESCSDKGNAAPSQSLTERLRSMDTEAFGTSRSELLDLLANAGSCEVASDGFVFSRSGRIAHYIGPCVARSEATAARLIASQLETDAGTTGWYWDLFPSNQDAVSCAEALGFTLRRVLWRMRRGEVMKNNDAMVYAIAGFELG
jgi:ribosomal protein S18 acetylase RimI-like enzyme